MFMEQILSWVAEEEAVSCGIPAVPPLKTGACRREARRCCNASAACPTFWYNIQPVRKKSTGRGTKNRKKAVRRFLTEATSKKLDFFHLEKPFCI